MIAIAEVVIPLVPENGPLGPTEGEEHSMYALIVKLAVIVLVANQLRKGRAWAWWVTIAFGALTVALTAGVVLAVIATQDWDGFGGVTAGTALLWLVELADPVLRPLGVPGSGSASTRRRGRRSAGGRAEDADQAGGSTMSWWLTWEGNSYHFANDGRTMIGYQRHLGVVIGLCDPVGPPELAGARSTNSRRCPSRAASLPACSPWQGNSRAATGAGGAPFRSPRTRSSTCRNCSSPESPGRTSAPRSTRPRRTTSPSG